MPQAVIFWALDFLSPIILLCLGLLFRLFPPKYGRGAYGYYTARSVDSEKAWRFAQKFYSSRAIITGLTVLVICYLDRFLPLPDAFIHTANALIGFASFLVPYLLTERELKNKFKK